MFYPDTLYTESCSENRNRKVISAAGDTGVFIHRRKDILIGLPFDRVAIFFTESYVYTVVSLSHEAVKHCRAKQRKRKWDLIRAYDDGVSCFFMSSKC